MKYFSYLLLFALFVGCSTHKDQSNRIFIDGAEYHVSDAQTYKNQYMIALGDLEIEVWANTYHLSGEGQLIVIKPFKDWATWAYHDNNIETVDPSKTVSVVDENGNLTFNLIMESGRKVNGNWQFVKKAADLAKP